MFKPKTRILLNLFWPQRRKPDPRHAIAEADKDLSGKTIVFTGGTDGIGRVAVAMLYRMGAHVVLLARSPAKGVSVIGELAATAGGRGKISLQACDLASMDSVKACAERILSEHGRIDVLVNNAGVNMTTPVITEDGFETNWAINYLGPRLLTQLLLERLQASAPSRIVNLTTNTAFIDRFDVDALRTKPDLATDNTYVEAKLAMNMFSIDLARQLEGTGVTVNYLYPGYIRSNLLSDLRGAQKIMQFFMRVMASPAEVGADRIVRLAVSSAYRDISGAHVSEDDIRPHHPEAQVAAKRHRLDQTIRKVLSRWLTALPWEKPATAPVVSTGVAQPLAAGVLAR